MVQPIPQFGGTAEENVAAARGDFDAVAMKAYARLCEAWNLNHDDAAALADMARRTWDRARGGHWTGHLGQDQRLRLSGVIGLYKGLRLFFGDDLANRWVMTENRAIPFCGRTPLIYMIDGGLPAILRTRNYIDAVRGGV